MSVLELQVGQTAVGSLKFLKDPVAGAVASDNAAVCPITMGEDGVTWTAGPALTVGIAKMTFGDPNNAEHSEHPPIAPMFITVVEPYHEGVGDFDPAGATVTGP